MPDDPPSGQEQRMRIFPWWVFASAIAVLAMVAAAMSSAIGAAGDPSTATRVAAGTGLAVLAGLLSGGWAWLLLWLGGGRPGVCMAVLCCFLLSPFTLVAAAVSLLFARISERYPDPGQAVKRFGVKARWAAFFVAVLYLLATLALPTLDQAAAAVLVASSVLIPLACHLPRAWQGSHLSRSPSAIVMLAIVVGMFSGMMDGAWEVVQPATIPAFISDKTWGLSGTANGCTIHLNNMLSAKSVHLTPNFAATAAGSGATPPKPTPNFSCPGTPKAGTAEATAALLVCRGGHQYTNGFAVSPNAAFTEGNVSTNINAGDDLTQIEPCLIEHEAFHMTQNRIFGPLFIIIYALWFVVLMVPGLIAGALLGIGHGATTMANAIDGLMAFSYCNNPFEAWAYGDNNPDAQGVLIKNTALRPLLLWPFSVVILAGCSFGLLGALMLWQLIAGVWLRRRWWIGGGGDAVLVLPRTPLPTLALQDLLIANNALLNGCLWYAMVGGSKGINGQAAIVMMIVIIGLLPATSITRFPAYHAVLAWSSLLMPTCWFGHVVGVALVVLNPPGLWLGNVWRLIFSGATAAELHWWPPFSCPGPVINVGHWLQGWIADFARLLSCAWYGAIAPSALYPGERTLERRAAGGHEPALTQGDASRIPDVERKVLRGHQLNHAAFGVAALGRWAEDEALSFWEAMAESLNEPRDRLSTPHDQGADRQRLSMWGDARSTTLVPPRD